ncbi:DUF1592 domain-containing protein [Gemmatimonas sp.]|uniref:DUF1592 domain-containing protein n=1 Tax=Gemmatimonas sp. TaxID=1962908 RepID=UPI0022C8817C|nr:DUF1592 domain-containing protein [Gemmatimonas sp.]MCZ8205218.1 DUF1592 domain-containing protein [Gemmatimonas sp.]
MKMLSALAVTLSVALLSPPPGIARPNPRPEAAGAAPRNPAAIHPVLRRAGTTRAPARLAPAALNGVVKQYCGKCHNDTMKRGNLTLSRFDVASPFAQADIAERMVAKLRTGMMPPVGSARPVGDTLDALVMELETRLDSVATIDPDPGRRTFQRLNRAEYQAAVKQLLGVEIDAAQYLPPDTKSDNFDNIADVQALSPTLLGAYLRAAGDISWLAVGNPRASAGATTYTMPKLASQTAHVEGAPFGTRGGMVVTHLFPADGEYRFGVNFFHETTGAFAGGLARGEALEIAIDGERVALVEIDRFMHASDPNGVAQGAPPVRVTAGPHKVSAAFVPPRFQGVVQDLISPLKYSLNSTSNAVAYGFTLLPHLRELTITGPYAPSGVSDSHIRRRLFSCHPTTAAAERPCALSIVNRLGTQAYRRPLTDEDRGGLMALYDAERTRGGNFEQGVRLALEGMLASPDFVFRFERAPSTAPKSGRYALRDIDLASRLSFFLWSAPPDDALLTVAARGALSQPGGLEREVKRMLADPRAHALSTRFAAQWLRLPDLDVVTPDIRQYPDFDEQLRTAMRRETELFFDDLVRRDRPVLDLYRADYTFVNERLAQHYGMKQVVGPAFRRVSYPDATRRGLLSHASILTLTSHATRTSAVDRGKWVMEVLLNSPPPPPPPGVPDLEATPGTDGGRPLTVRERMEQHRKNPSCSSCHKMMDPIGLALEQYDATGKVRLRDNGMPIDSRGDLWDGSTASNAVQLQTALLRREEALMRTFTRNLMAYAVGRRMEATDMPSVRRIVRDAGRQQHRMSAYIMGVVKSPAFRMQKIESSPTVESGASGAASLHR